MIVISKEVELDAGHRVPTHASKCKNLHGHRYKVKAEMRCEELVPDESGRSNAGMVMDFGVLKQALMEVIHDPFDHKLILWEHDPLLQAFIMVTSGIPEVYSPLGFGPAEEERPKTGTFDALKPLLAVVGISEGLVVVPCIPTAENLARLWFESVAAYLRGRVGHEMAEGAHLVRLEVYETPTSCAVYMPT